MLILLTLVKVDLINLLVEFISGVYPWSSTKWDVKYIIAASARSLSPLFYLHKLIGRFPYK